MSTLILDKVWTHSLNETYSKFPQEISASTDRWLFFGCAVIRSIKIHGKLSEYFKLGLSACLNILNKYFISYKNMN